MPKDGWQNKELELVFIGGGLFILLLMTGLMIAVLILNQRRKNLHWLAQTDALTNVYNRSGFDQVLDQHIEAHANFSFVVAELDIDNFKFINDMYGHAAGDLALQSLRIICERLFWVKLSLVEMVGMSSVYCFLTRPVNPCKKN